MLNNRDFNMNLLFSFVSCDNNENRSLGTFIVDHSVFQKFVEYANSTWGEDYLAIYDLSSHASLSELCLDFLADYEDMTELEMQYGVHDISSYEINQLAVNFNVDSYEVYEKFEELMIKWKESFENFGCSVSEIKIEKLNNISDQLIQRINTHLS
jgi:uncharacterized protein (DUF4213/DUF364 family)